VLQEVYGADDPDLWRALKWLARTQLTAAQAGDPALNPDGDPAGSWVETEFTGTGFPKVFYLRYHLYRHYFPLMAIGRALAAHGIAVPERGQNGAGAANSTRELVAG
jgi:squalene cyclase